METEATHVTRMQNRRRMIIMLIRGAMSQRGIKRTPDAGRSQIMPTNSRKTTRPFLFKQKTKVKHKTKKQITKFLTHMTGDSRRQQKGISLEMLKDISLPTMDNKQQHTRNQHEAFCGEELTRGVGVNYSTSYEPFTCLTRSRVAGR